LAVEDRKKADLSPQEKGKGQRCVEKSLRTPDLVEFRVSQVLGDPAVGQTIVFRGLSGFRRAATSLTDDRKRSSVPP
jgi:hypothetical protein